MLGGWSHICLLGPGPDTNLYSFEGSVSPSTMGHPPFQLTTFREDEYSSKFSDLQGNLGCCSHRFKAHSWGLWLGLQPSKTLSRWPGLKTCGLSMYASSRSVAGSGPGPAPQPKAVGPRQEVQP